MGDDQDDVMGDDKDVIADTTNRDLLLERDSRIKTDT